MVGAEEWEKGPGARRPEGRACNAPLRTSVVRGLLWTWRGKGSVRGRSASFSISEWVLSSAQSRHTQAENHAMTRLGMPESVRVR
jgi:hypothetical protein